MAAAPEQASAGRRALNAVASFFKGRPKREGVHPDLARLLANYSTEFALLKFSVLNATESKLESTERSYRRLQFLFPQVWTWPRDKESEVEKVFSMYYDKIWESRELYAKGFQVDNRKYRNLYDRVLFYFDHITKTIPEKILKPCVYSRSGRLFVEPKQEELDCFVYRLFYLWTKRASRPTFTVQTLAGDKLTCKWPKPSPSRRPDLHAAVRAAAKALRENPSSPHHFETHDFELVTESGNSVNNKTFFHEFEQYLKNMKISLTNFILNNSLMTLAECLFQEATIADVRIVQVSDPRQWSDRHQGPPFQLEPYFNGRNLPAKVAYVCHPTGVGIKVGELVHSVNGKSTIGLPVQDLQRMPKKNGTRLVVTPPDWKKSIEPGFTPVDVTFLATFLPTPKKRDAFVHLII